MKICFICIDFEEKNLRKQPWVYIYQLCQDFLISGNEVIVVSNSVEGTIEKITIRHVNSVYSVLGLSQQTLTILEKEDPNFVFMVLGLTSFLRPLLRIKRPLIGVLTSPIYRLKELRSIGFEEFIRHWRYLYIHIIGALIPKWMINQCMLNYDHIIVLSKENKKRLKNLSNVKKISVIRPKIDDIFLSPPNLQNIQVLKSRENPIGIPVVLYYTSPLTLRGTDTLIKAFSIVRKQMPCSLIVLSRPDNDEMKNEIRLLESIAKKEGVSESVIFHHGTLSKQEIVDYLRIADIICLPFKIVISDVPISILEGMSLGKTIISTNVSSIRELLVDEREIVEPNNVIELAERIHFFLINKKIMDEIGLQNQAFLFQNLLRDKNIIHSLDLIK